MDLPKLVAKINLHANLPTFRAAKLKSFTVVRRAGYSVRPSVRPSMGLQQQTRCCRFTVVGPAGRISIIAAAAAGECGQCHVVSVRR